MLGRETGKIRFKTPTEEKIIVIIFTVMLIYHPQNFLFIPYQLCNCVMLMFFHVFTKYPNEKKEFPTRIPENIKIYVRDMNFLFTIFFILHLCIFFLLSWCFEDDVSIQLEYLVGYGEKTLRMQYRRARCNNEVFKIFISLRKKKKTQKRSCNKFFEMIMNQNHHVCI